MLGCILDGLQSRDTLHSFIWHECSVLWGSCCQHSWSKKKKVSLKPSWMSPFSCCKLFKQRACVLSCSDILAFTPTLHSPEAVAGPTPFRELSSAIAACTSGRRLKAFLEHFFTVSSLLEATSCCSLGLNFPLCRKTRRATQGHNGCRKCYQRLSRATLHSEGDYLLEQWKNIFCAGALKSLWINMISV